jgi:hypothetical protein
VPQHGIVIYVTREENVAFHPESKVYVITTFFLFLEKKKLKMQMKFSQNQNKISRFSVTNVGFYKQFILSLAVVSCFLKIFGSDSE